LIEASRGGQKRRVALLYSSATDNAIYKQLDPNVDHFFTFGELYKLESFAYGISKPVAVADDFHHLLVKWNAESSTGKFAPNADAVSIEASPANIHNIVSEQPLQAIWLRLRQLESVTLAEKLVIERAASERQSVRS
jgi:hypothetical protein